MSALIAGAAAPLTLTVDMAPLTPITNSAVGTDSESLPPRRNYFLGIHSLKGWAQGVGEKAGEVTLTSPPLDVPLAWNEMVPSWNATLAPDATLTVEVRVIYAVDASGPARTTKFYSMGRWSGDPAKNPRQSVKKQRDEDGTVDTDTLQLKRRGGQIQLRLTLGWEGQGGAEGETTTRDLSGQVRFLALAFLDNATKVAPAEPNRAAWGKTLAVPERFQLDFKDLGGAVWCSPTSVSMLLAYWSKIVNRPELTLTVPQVAGAVVDPNWPGTGNWSFNASFAGSFPGVRGYVARLDDLSEVESWIAAGVPVALSVNYSLLKGKPRDNSGHLVVCVGFTTKGDAVIADPYKYTAPNQSYTVFPRKDVITGWGASSNTVYLIYPDSTVPPVNSVRHWDG